MLSELLSIWGFDLFNVLKNAPFADQCTNLCSMLTVFIYGLCIEVLANLEKLGTVKLLDQVKNSLAHCIIVMVTYE